MLHEHVMALWNISAMLEYKERQPNTHTYMHAQEHENSWQNEKISQ